MGIEFDAAKNDENIAKHGISFADFEGFDGEPITLPDDRNDYGEPRFRSFGRIDGQCHCLVHTERAGALRLISLRRAHEKEVRRYEQFRHG
jgi:uncharacterized protein